MAEHTPTPWKVCDTVRETGHVKIAGCGFAGLVATIGNGQVSPDLYASNAAFIVKACNSHDALVFALTELYQSFEFCVGKDTPVALEAKRVLAAVGQVGSSGK